MPLVKNIAITAFMATASAHSSNASTILIPDDHPTIQAGIDAAAPGDTVEIRCGTYYEHNITMRPSVVVRSETGNASCVTIDAQEMDRVFNFPSAGIGKDTMLHGVTLTRGRATSGAGMLCRMASPSIVNCDFVGNYANFITLGAGGADLFDSSPSFTNCVFDGNYGPAIFASNCNSLAIINCTFYRSNSHPNDGAALFMTGTHATMTNTIIAFGVDGEPIKCGWGQPSSAILRCCDVFGNARGDWVGCIANQAGADGNFSLDPHFCGALHGDLALSASSPCAPEHSPPGCGLIGALSVECDAQGTEAVTWGRIKAHFW